MIIYTNSCDLSITKCQAIVLNVKLLKEYSNVLLHLEIVPSNNRKSIVVNRLTNKVNITKYTCTVEFLCVEK